MGAAILQSKLTASVVGSIVERQSEVIQQVASEYDDKKAELDKMVVTEPTGGAQHHKRQTTSLQKQIDQQHVKFCQVKNAHEELLASYNNNRIQYEKLHEDTQRMEKQLNELTQLEAHTDPRVVGALRDLVMLSEDLQLQEQEFRSHCKDEMTRLHRCIEDHKPAGSSPEDQERLSMIVKQHDSDKEKVHKLRLLLARKNREISGLQRKIDEVPTRAELSQYQRRFVELYNQVAAKHKETKQFYTLYNTLDDTKLYLNKEVLLLNSIYDNFEQAMSSSGGKEQYLKQLESINEGVRQNRAKLEKRKTSEKMRRDQFNEEYLNQIEKQRLYFKTVKDFKEECRKNEILLMKLE